MATMITGRTLNRERKPIDGTGFEYDSGSRIAEFLAQRVSPVYSQPVTKEWVFALVTGAQANGEYERGVGVFAPGNSGPPEHSHPNYEERFEVVQGEFIFRLAGREQRYFAGEKVIVRKGTPHTFRCVSTVPGVALVETWPAARVGQVIATLFGMAHEGLLTTKGQPKFMQGIVIGSEYADDTVFTNPPPNIAIPMAKALAPLARMLGYRSVDIKYTEEKFWNAHVEQTPDGRRSTAVETRQTMTSPAAVQPPSVDAALSEM